MRVIVGLNFNVPDFPLRNQLTVNGTAGAYQLFGRVADELIGPLVAFQFGAVHRDFLGDIRGDQVVVIAGLPQVIILPFGGLIRQVKRFTDVGLYRFIIRAQVKEVLMEGFDVIPQLNRQIGLALGRERGQQFSIVQDMNPALCQINRLGAFIDAKAHGQHIADDQQDAELPDVLEGGIYVFKLCEHECYF